ncbi:unnamed protein product, partial [Mesorhabditis belari]|uniref:Arrestin C-terminal-like domain-containing protein n=1 Tax=Mesorhabditis belari TaxID=2138241 RepID=A0AAF3FCG2_9BILA
MRIEHFDLVLDRNLDTPYVGGDIVKGEITIHATRPVKVAGLHVRLFGLAETGWYNKNTDVVFESRETVLDEPIDLTVEIFEHCNPEYELHDGLHKISFETHLPLDVVSSVEREGFGSVRYTCSAILHLPEDGGSEFISEKTFKVWSLLNLDAPYLRESTSVTEEEELHGCCGSSKGMLMATMQVAEIGLLPGETTRLTLTLENRTKPKRWRKRDSNKECVLVSLCQQIDFVARNRYESHLSDRRSITIAVETHGTCKAAPGKGPQTKVIDFTIPSDLPPTSIQAISTDVLDKANGLVTCSYFFKLDLEHFDVVVPVILGSRKTPGPID